MIRQADKDDSITANQDPIFPLLIACAGIECLLFVWLCFLGREAFTQFVWTPDTPGYVSVALPLATTFTLTPGSRTLGYPLFLALGYVSGGSDNWMHVVIALQLILNILFTWGCWKLMQRLVPAAGGRLRTAATLFFFWAGLGMALLLMTDFLAALCFGVFLYGMLFWRTHVSVIFAAVCLAIATLTRPTFTFIPFLLPIASHLAGRVTSTLPRYYLATFMAFSLLATGVSIAYQYTFSKYVGPSPAALRPIEEMLYYGTVEGKVPGSDYEVYQKQFEAEIAKRADRQYAMLSPGERDKYAKQIFREQLGPHLNEIVANYATNVVKYLFAPVESTFMRLTELYISEQTYLSYVRPVLGLVCLPIWLCSLVPPLSPLRQHKMYYLLVIVMLVYVVGLSAIGTGAGERYRFPVLAFMLPVTVWNIHLVRGYVHARIVTRRRVTTRHSLD